MKKTYSIEDVLDVLDGVETLRPSVEDLIAIPNYRNGYEAGLQLVGFVDACRIAGLDDDFIFDAFFKIIELNK